jgi:hypothetical protein
MSNIYLRLGTDFMERGHALNTRRMASNVNQMSN